MPVTDIVERLKIEAANQREIASGWSGEKRDLHIENAIRSEEAASEIERLRRALFAALHDVEVIVCDNTPTDLEWKEMPNGGEVLVRRSLEWRRRDRERLIGAMVAEAKELGIDDD